MSEKEISSFQRKIYKCIRGFIYIYPRTRCLYNFKQQNKKNSTKQNNAKEEKNDLLHRSFSSQNELHIFIMV